MTDFFALSYVCPKDERAGVRAWWSITQTNPSMGTRFPQTKLSSVACEDYGYIRVQVYFVKDNKYIFKDI